MIDLNEDQKFAVDHVEGPMLILAGAGSGKTRVVTYRIARLLERGIPPAEILALTFTNKAADEMRSRIHSLTQQSISTSTFHSLGARILRTSIDSLGYRRDFAIYDEGEGLQLVRDFLSTVGRREDKGLSKSLKRRISHAKNDLFSSGDLAGDLPTQEGQLLEGAFAFYRDRLREYNALDFDDLLYLTVELFRKHPDVLEIYQKKWSFISIDEYQDTNVAQYFMAKLLSARHRNIFAVGDPDQSIYSWRGANMENILRFEQDYAEAKVISLQRNYRSTTRILEGANALIQHNARHYPKELWSDLGKGERIRVFMAENAKHEALFVLREIVDRVKKEGLAFGECAVFYRTNAQSQILEDLFLAQRIPYTIIGGISFYQRREVKDILAFLRMVVSDADFLSFVRTIALFKGGIGKTTLGKLRDLVESGGLPILSLCRELVEGRIDGVRLMKRQVACLRDYLHCIDLIREFVAREIPLEELIREVVERVGYLSILQEDPESYRDRKENINLLINKGVEWGGSGDLLGFLESLSLQSSVDDFPTRDSVKFMTLHNGKGLEFPLVFLVGMEEDLFPHINAKDSIEAIQEERRLCYVGMTRARRLLYLTAARHRFLWGTSKEMHPSRFLGEIHSDSLLFLNTDREGFVDFGTHSLT